MGFRLVAKSVILNDRERRIGCYFAYFITTSGSFGVDYVKVVEEVNMNSTCLPRTANTIVALLAVVQSSIPLSSGLSVSAALFSSSTSRSSCDTVSIAKCCRV